MPDAYTSTIIRCSASSAPVIATNNTRARPDTDTQSAATVIDDVDAASASQVKPQPSHFKTTPNYVSVVQIGSSASIPAAVNEKRVIPAVTMTSLPADSVVNAPQSSPSSRQHQLSAASAAHDVTGTTSTPIKSSLKKDLTPSHHTKNKSVSFSTAGGSLGAYNEFDVTSTATSNRQSADTRRQLGLAEAIVRLDRDRVDGIAPRRSLVSDSGVFCELDDDQTPPGLTGGSEENKTATQPSRRTTVIVSGGVASMKNSPKHQHHQRQRSADSDQLQDIARPGAGNTGSLRQGSSAATYVMDGGVETVLQATTNDASPSNIRRRNSDIAQASCSSFCSC